MPKKRYFEAQIGDEQERMHRNANREPIGMGRGRGGRPNFGGRRNEDYGHGVGRGRARGYQGEGYHGERNWGHHQVGRKRGGYQGEQHHNRYSGEGE